MSKQQRDMPLGGLLWIIGMLLLAGCDKADQQKTPTESDKSATVVDMALPSQAETQPVRTTRDYKVAHVFVVLCDNRNQGIVPVPPELGNGQQPRTNLYWGAMYGVKTFFGSSPNWSVVKGVAGPDTETILDRLLFRAETSGRTTYVLADAYDGAHMLEALKAFFDAAAGNGAVEVDAGRRGSTLKIQAGGLADMVCFVGHNGLMDVRLKNLPKRRLDGGPECAVVLACKSRDYFAAPLGRLKCRPLITTSGFMAPEAYTLEAVIRSWANNDPPPAIHEAAAKAYAKYQRCGLRAARRLFVLGR